MHFPVYIVLVLVVGRLCDAQESETDEKIDVLINSIGLIQSKLNSIELQLTTLEGTVQDVIPKINNLESKSQRSQDEIQESLEVLYELSLKLDDLNTKMNGNASNDHSMVTSDRPSGSDNSRFPNSCADNCKDATCDIKVSQYSCETFSVLCENNKLGNGWTVIQKRENGLEDFERNWVDYKSGFGNKSDDFWIGLEKLHALTTSQGRQQLLVTLEDYRGNTKYALYDAFEVGPESKRYQLKLGTYTGNAGNSLGYHENGFFHTKDNDRTKNCVRDFKGGWWYKDCLRTNPNGLYYRTEKPNAIGTGIYWKTFVDANHSLKSIKMMIKPKSQSSFP
uniref:Fibrinogen C-terminal domain-containing protein n=1 Tax=Glossina brevipalpis TaxID=37001 RepID=A0A1A9WDG0_9MUSC